LERIKESGWRSIASAATSCVVALTCARSSDAAPRYAPVALDFVEQVYGGWLEGAVLPLLNKHMRQKRSSCAPKSRARYAEVTRAVLFAYFLQRGLQELDEHKKHDIRPGRLASAAHALLGKHRAEAISGALDFADHELKAILDSWPVHVLRHIVRGSVCCVDETVFPHYGKIAHDEGKLMLTPGKPYDYGMRVYLLCQRLHFSNPSPSASRCTGRSGGRTVSDRRSHCTDDCRVWRWRCARCARGACH
jgi:hypothetical protein